MKLLQQSTALLLCALLLAQSKGQPSLIKELLQKVQAMNYPGYRKCDVLMVDDAPLDLYSDGHASVTLDIDHSQSFPKELLQKNSACVILIAQRNNKTASMQQYLDLVKRVGDSTIILFGEEFGQSDILWTEKLVIQVQVEHPNLAKQAKVSMLCSPRRSSIGGYEKFRKGSEDLHYVPISVWTRGKELRNIDVIRYCEHPLERRLLNITYSIFPPFTFRARSLNSDPTGTEVEFLRILAKKFNFKLLLKSAEFVGLDKKTGKILPGGAVGEVRVGSSQMAIGYKTFVYENYQDVDFSSYLYFESVVWATRNPQRLPSYDNMIRVFSATVWIVFYATVTILSVSFATVFAVYHKFPEEPLLRRRRIPWIDFILLPLAKFVHFEPLPWFRTWSTGRILIMLWSILTLLMVSFYLSNLRAWLIAKKYEKPVVTLKDAAEKAKLAYLPSFSYPLNHEYNPNLSKYQRLLSIIVHATEKGLYDFSKYGGLPPFARENVINNGAFYLLTESSILYEFLSNKSYGFPNVQFTKEVAASSKQGIFWTKFAPWRREMNRVIAQLRDMGIFKKLLYEKIPIEARIKWSPKAELQTHE